MCSIWQSFQVFFLNYSWGYSWHVTLSLENISKVSSAYSIVGINALHMKKCWRWSLLWVYQKIWEPCRKATCTHGTMHPPFLSHSRVSMFPFPPSLSLFKGMEEELAFCGGATHALPKSVFKLLNGPHRQMVHKVSQDAAQAPPAGAHRTPLLFGQCCASLILTATGFLGCV